MYSVHKHHNHCNKNQNSIPNQTSLYGVYSAVLPRTLLQSGYQIIPVHLRPHGSPEGLFGYGTYVAPRALRPKGKVSLSTRNSAATTFLFSNSICFLFRRHPVYCPSVTAHLLRSGWKFKFIINLCFDKIITSFVL